MAARQSPWSSLPCASAGGGAERRRASGARESARAHVESSLSLSVAGDCPRRFHVKQASRNRAGRGVDMRLAASRACSCVARALVSPARDLEHIEAGMHKDGGRARDESPEDGLGVRRKFRVAETWYA